MPKSTSISVRRAVSRSQIPSRWVHPCPACGRRVRWQLALCWDCRGQRLEDTGAEKMAPMNLRDLFSDNLGQHALEALGRNLDGTLAECGIHYMSRTKCPEWGEDDPDTIGAFPHGSRKAFDL